MICTPLAIILISSLVLISAEPKTRFTNAKCETLDPTHCVYKECRLKVLGRGIIGLNIHVLLLKGPYYNAKINLSLWRKYNGFQPFLYNVTLEFCKFMRQPRLKLTFESMVVDALADKSNINHTCPYEKEIILRNLIFEEKYLHFLPLPSGEYQFRISVAIANNWITKIYVTISRQEDLIKV